MKTNSASATSSPGLLQARYTHFHGMPDMAGIVNVDNVALDLRNCSVYSGKLICDLPFDPERVDVINNLFERAVVTFNAPSGDRPLDFRNNTAINSTLTFTANGNSFTCFVKDSLFDHSTVTATPIAGEEGGISSGNNAHRLGSLSAGFSSTALSADIQYATGTFGDRYIDPSYSGLSSLVNGGSRSAAAAGLSAYTILSDETQDTGTVDMVSAGAGPQ